MNLNEYINESYTVEPLSVTADLLRPTLYKALTQLMFKLEEEKSYKLYITKDDLYYIQEVINCPIKLNVSLDETLHCDAWYLVDEKAKKLIYSPGALGCLCKKRSQTT